MRKAERRGLVSLKGDVLGRERNSKWERKRAEANGVTRTRFEKDGDTGGLHRIQVRFRSPVPLGADESILGEDVDLVARGRDGVVDLGYLLARARRMHDRRLCR